MWFMADAGQWNMVVKGLTGCSDDLSTTANNNLSYDKMNVKIATTGATPIDNFQHWTAWEYNDAKAWEYHQSGYLIQVEKTSECRVRPIFTF